MKDEIAKTKNELMNLLLNLDSSNVDFLADAIERLIDLKLVDAFQHMGIKPTLRAGQ